MVITIMESEPWGGYSPSLNCCLEGTAREVVLV